MDELTTIFDFYTSADALVAQNLVRLAIWAALGFAGGLAAFRQSQHSESVLDAIITVPVALGLMAAALWMAVFVDYPALQTARELQHAYDQRQYQVAEGAVHIIAARNGWSTFEEIQIGPAHFTIDGNAESPGYHLPAQGSGLLTEGAYARVYYYGDSILRIDAKASTLKAETTPALKGGQAQWGTPVSGRSVYWHPLTEP